MFLYPCRIAIPHSQTPKCYLLHSPNRFSTTSDSTQQSFTNNFPLKASKRINFTTPEKPISFSTTSDSTRQPFAISYLTYNLGLSPKDALKAFKRLSPPFTTPEKPNSVITFFKIQGFSIHQIQSIVRKNPTLLVSKPIKTLLPKLLFLSSKGVSPTDLVAIVTSNPQILCVSLEKHLIPAFQLVSSFCPSNQKAIDSIIVCPTLITDNRLKPNVQFLIDFGLTPSCIYHFLKTRPSLIYSYDLRKAVEEIKELGFDPSKVPFAVALLAKKAITKSKWDAKVDVLKRWGFSEDAIFGAFKRQPTFMLRSPEKLNAVMSFWVEEFGWDPSLLLASPTIFGYSIEKRLTPRASVVRYLLSKGLIKKSACFYTSFNLSDELFMKKYVNCYEEESSRLLRLYQGKDASI